MLPVALYIDADDAEIGAAVSLFLAREPGLVFVGLAEPPAGGAGAFAVEVERPTAAEQRVAWIAALGDEDSARALTGQFDLNLREIAEVAAASGGGGLKAAWDLCRRRLRTSSNRRDRSSCSRSRTTMRVTCSRRTAAV